MFLLFGKQNNVETFKESPGTPREYSSDKVAMRKKLKQRKYQINNVRTKIISHPFGIDDVTRNEEKSKAGSL